MARIRNTGTDIAGNRFSTAYDLGKFTDTSVVVDEFVGNSDLADYYKFSINKSSLGIIALTGLQANADIEIYNQKKQSLGKLSNLGTKREYSAGNNPRGTYYLRVFPRGGGNTTYRLTLLTITA